MKQLLCTKQYDFVLGLTVTDLV